MKKTILLLIAIALLSYAQNSMAWGITFGPITIFG
jgi:hypothetical protein